MAGDRPGGEPTEEPTPRRIRQAREKGQIAKSGDFSSSFAFAAAFGAFTIGAAFMGQRLSAIVHNGLSRATAQGQLQAGLVLTRAARDVGMLVAPILGAAFVAALTVGYLQAGGLFTLKPLVPDFKKLNPIAGLKNIFSKRTAFELLKSVVKLTAIGGLAYVTMRPYIADLPRLAGTPAPQALSFVGMIAIKLGLRVVVLYVIIGAADLLWQRRTFKKDQMMTREEVKREHKESEGDPQHKADRQRLHRELGDQQTIAAVKDADCVIVNPDHIAVALRFDQESMDAPQVVAKGERLIAQQIKEIARRYGVPIYRDVRLARALNELELDDQIPAELYDAVAELLRFIYQQDEEEPGEEQD